MTELLLNPLYALHKFNVIRKSICYWNQTIVSLEIDDLFEFINQAELDCVVTSASAMSNALVEFLKLSMEICGFKSVYQVKAGVAELIDGWNV
ncbi:hypothetical protein SAMN04487869_11010 [Marinobacter sp. DSM 26671]|nr:hypothetical protein SAMN04487869_11010 [Marinobacter sp. DSM 26671]